MNRFEHVNLPEIGNDDEGIYLLLPTSVVVTPIELQDVQGGSCPLPPLGSSSTDFLPLGDTTIAATSLQEVNFNSPQIETPSHAHQVDKNLSPPPNPPPPKRKRGRPRKVRKPAPQTTPRVKKYDLEPTTKRIRNAVAARRNRILAKEREQKLKNDLALKDDIILRQSETIERLNFQISEYKRRLEIIRSAASEQVDILIDDTNADVEGKGVDLIRPDEFLGT
ncbi:hypothetical protein Fcan01_15427 [Folsomia candida]|uniref:BZIP domain-containing protein n=1 Tax=Folsomia candida TaxID=158441 RepID=A0A226DW06_FOLCA|nr:hypothetical protein Fcan01_15427 [Folsomia candida]